MPHNFELWYTHLGGTNPELSRRLLRLLNGGHAPSPEALQTLYAECIGPCFDLDAGAIEDGSEAIEQAAQETIEQLVGGRRNLQDYGAALSRVEGQLGGNQTVTGLLQAIAMLTAETTRASEHNRALEQRLTASAARINRLRHSLAEVKQEATTDALTGLINRRGFDARLRRAMTRLKVDHVGMSAFSRRGPLQIV